MADDDNSDDGQAGGVVGYDPGQPVSVLGNAGFDPGWSVAGPSVLGGALNPSAPSHAEASPGRH